MLLRDPVHGLLVFEGIAEQLLAKLLRCREVQRLRRVRQLGLTSLVFPGAEHSRFVHALGTAHIMMRLHMRVDELAGDIPTAEKLDGQARLETLAAAFLHDLGHGPFSHLFEDAVPNAIHHETWTVRALLDPATDVHKALREFDVNMPERVAGLLRGQHRLSYLSHSVSGMWDVDRCDYLLRDCHMTGVRYGIFDLDWLLQSWCVCQGDDGKTILAIDGQKGIAAFENFFLSRQFMYQQVYHHSATRAAEVLTSAIFKRVAQLIRAGQRPTLTPPALSKAVLGQPIDLEEYFALDDAQIQAGVAAWVSGSDTVLAELCRAWLQRDLPKCFDLDPNQGQEAWESILSDVRDGAGASGCPSDLLSSHIVLDIAHDVPFKEPDADDERVLWVRQAHGGMCRLGQASFLLAQIRNKLLVRPRLICMPAYTDIAKKAIQETR